jgi:hypothetical protein
LVGENQIDTTNKARNIGAVFDDHFQFDSHVNAICRGARYHLRNIGRIRKYLDRDTLLTLVHAFITCKLDFMNS